MSASTESSKPTGPNALPERSSYSKAVLSIKTPVSVTLAHKKFSLDRIIQLAPGAMLTFDAHCDEPLTLEAGGKPIATGEAVKIGDKFGLRIREVLSDRSNADED